MPDADDAQRELAYGARGAPGPTDSPAELLAAVGAVATATLAAQLRKRGYNSVTLDRLHAPGGREDGRIRQDAALRAVPRGPVRRIRGDTGRRRDERPEAGR